MNMSDSQANPEGKSSLQRPFPTHPKSKSSQRAVHNDKAIQAYNFKSYFENEASMERLQITLTLTTASKIRNLVRFMSPDEFEATIKKQLLVLEKYMNEHDDEEGSGSDEGEYLVDTQTEWANWTNPDICMMAECGRTYYGWHAADDCYTIPVNLTAPDKINSTGLFPLTTRQERILCFSCALKTIQKSSAWSGCSNPKELEGQEADRKVAHSDSILRGLSMELQHVRICCGVNPTWQQAAKAIPTAVLELSKIMKSEDGTLTSQLQQHWQVLKEHTRASIRYIQLQPNLARPVMLMGAPWFWNAFDIFYAIANRDGHFYQTDATAFDGPRIAERVMEAWSQEMDRLFDGPLRMLRGRNASKDVQVVEGLVRAVLNSPPIELTGHQADLRAYWHYKMDTTMGPFWRAGPLGKDPAQYWVHPDMRPTSIALRLLEVMPGVLSKIFTRTLDVTPNTQSSTKLALEFNQVEPWHVLNDRYFQFIVTALNRFVGMKSTDLKRAAPDPAATMKSGLAKASRLL